MKKSKYKEVHSQAGHSFVASAVDHSFFKKKNILREATGIIISQKSPPVGRKREGLFHQFLSPIGQSLPHDSSAFLSYTNWSSYSHCGR